MVDVRGRSPIAAALLVAALQSAAAQQQPADTWALLDPALERFGITLPLQPVHREAVRRGLEELTRERCDTEAIKTLASALQKAGQRRDAAKAHVRFSDTCNGQPESLRLAVNLYLVISDYETAAKVATEFIALKPLYDNGYFLRALAHDRGNQPKKAIDDYVSAIELFQPKDKISDVSFVGLARSYEKAGAPCDAALAIESWAALNPARNETPQVRDLIAAYSRKGNCAPTASGTEDVFPTARQGGVVVIPITVNGVRGLFILDTGASFVAMKGGFADKAKVRIDHDSVIRLGTANGVGVGKRGRADKIQFKTLEVQNVPVVVQSDDKGAYGEKIDGLLGMSALSHFTVSIDANSVRIRKRKAN